MANQYMLVSVEAYNQLLADIEALKVSFNALVKKIENSYSSEWQFGGHISKFSNDVLEAGYVYGSTPKGDMAKFKIRIKNNGYVYVSSEPMEAD